MSQKKLDLKGFFKKHEKLTKILLTLLIFVFISLFSTLLLSLFGIIYFDDGIQINRELFDAFKNTWYGYIIVVLAQIIITSLLSFVPGASMAFIILVKSLYTDPIVAFIVSFSGVLLSSFMLYVLGRFGGYTLGKKIIGEEDCEKASDLLNQKGAVYFPLMMMFPVFPDDALVMIAGTLKMSMKWFLPSIIIGRGIGVCTIIFGVSSVPYHEFTSPLHWILFVLSCLALIFFIFYLAHLFNKYLDKHSKKKQAKNSNITEKTSKDKENEVSDSVEV